MFQRTLAVLRVSPFSVFLKDLGKKNHLAGLHAKDGIKVASRMYKSLTPVQMKALKARAAKIRYPALDAFNRFQRQHAYRFTHLSNLQRQRVIGKMWRELRAKQGKPSKGKGRKTVKPKKVKKSSAKAAKKTAAKRKLKAKVKGPAARKMKVASLKFRASTPKFKLAPKLKKSKKSQRKVLA
ncbi:putative kinetoplast DNA-associated protein [Trypanosoma theileri]|uniref:Putative kinetoplast DNA-associated protein n=1 Tax=Trypanosoma theileri TaxID=67003 RepID=A0A1X0NSD7_9TRYP|nr:putative kinetoplast DNA-associated protein [Trypanosoma theileri]ORC87468.1 putative kinetoplast DNA-associated protein [Trypanosoma theileri]